MAGPSFLLAARNLGPWDRAGVNQSSRSWQIKERNFRPMGSTQEAVLAKDARRSCFLCLVLSSISVFLTAAGGRVAPPPLLFPLLKAVGMEAEHPAHPPLSPSPQSWNCKMKILGCSPGRPKAGQPWFWQESSKDIGGSLGRV